MHPSQIKKALAVAVDKQRPAFIWGPPGIGKSDIVASLAKEKGMELRDVRLNLMDPTDIKGFPVPDIGKGHMEWLPADFLPHMMIEKTTTTGKGKTAKTTTEVVPNDTKGILFLDELNQAPAMVQAAAYQLLLTRQVGNYKLPDGWSILAAGNRETDRANAQRMPSALSLRLVHLDMESSTDDWCAWALTAGICVELLTFIRYRPELLHKFDPAARVSPNPRSWTFVSELFNSGLDPEIEFEMIKGTVGEGPAAEFKAYASTFRELPSIDAIRLNPEGVSIPKSPSTLFAITGALAHATTPDSFAQIAKYIFRMEPEWQTVYMRDAMVRQPAITTMQPFPTWAINNSHLFT